MCIDKTFLFNGKKYRAIQQWTKKCYPHSAPSKTTTCPWYADLKRGSTDTNEAVTPENVSFENHDG